MIRNNIIGILILLNIEAFTKGAHNSDFIRAGEIGTIRVRRDVESSSKKSSLAFVFDTTVSMSDELSQVKQQATNILDAMVRNQNSPVNNFVLVPFNDPGVGPVTITSDPNLLRSKLNSISLYSDSYDCPEQPMAGIQRALEVSSYKSYIYVFTDATGKDYHLVPSIVDLIQTKKSEVFFLLTGNCTDRPREEYEAFETIARVSLGGVFMLDKWSINQILKYISMKLESDKVNVDFITVPRGHDIPHEVTVDDTLEEVIAEAVGPSVELEIINPQGKKASDTEDVIKMVDLPNVKIDKIVNPQQGKWTIKTGSTDKHELKITGKSELDFKLYFSSEAANGEFLDRPFKNTANEINLSVTGKSNIKMTYIELIDSVTGITIFRMELNEVETKDDISRSYKTDSFKPPDDTFYIAGIGIDDKGNSLRRMIGSGVAPIWNEEDEREYQKYSFLNEELISTQ